MKTEVQRGEGTCPPGDWVTKMRFRPKLSLLQRLCKHDGGQGPEDLGSLTDTVQLKGGEDCTFLMKT